MFTLAYEYKHVQTVGSTGYCRCDPVSFDDFETSFAGLESYPTDDFMRRHVLRLLNEGGMELFENLLEKAEANPLLASVLAESCIVNSVFAPYADKVPGTLAEHAALSPLCYLRAVSSPQHFLHKEWIQAFSQNIKEHRLLPWLDDIELAPVYDINDIKAFIATVFSSSKPQLKDLFAEYSAKPGQTVERQEYAKTIDAALERLELAGAFAGAEMRHEASLSPIALLRSWNINITVALDNADYVLAGTATSYGRGLSLAQARASCLMEIVERYSSYVNVGHKGVLNRAVGECPLKKARLSEFCGKDIAALNPNLLDLDVPYTDQSIYWVQAEAGAFASSAGFFLTGNALMPQQKIWVPAQLVYLFCNLDEPALTFATGSTGLASGNTMAEARLSALLEYIERDAEATTPYDRNKCFILESDDSKVSALLADYAARGVAVHFQDCTTEFGVPAFKCFVMTERGQIVYSCGSGLDAKRALISALTETPYPYPQSPPSAPALKGLPVKKLEDFPDYTLESAERNVALLEDLLAKHAKFPLYVDLTREDLQFPVVRALVTGLESSADFETWSPVSQRLFARYMVRELS